MKRIIIPFALLFACVVAKAQVGMNCQYFPGAQFGFVNIKTEGNTRFDKVKFGAGVPLLMIDRVTNHWYINVDMSALYYAATQTNKANDDRIKISKGEGG